MGPVCESSDRFAKARLIDRVREGDLAILRDVGRMARRWRPAITAGAGAEVMVEGDRYAVIAPRIDAAAIRPQVVPDWLEGARTRPCGMRKGAVVVR